MFEFFRSKKREPELPAIAAHVPDGQRVYAVGDIHGRSDLLIALIEAIEIDNRDNPAAVTTVILLGDLIDRGPDSVNVLALAREWRKFRDVRILAGNHEEMFLRSFDDVDLLRHFLRHGGRETLMSYGLPKRLFTASSLEEIMEAMEKVVPQSDRDFIASFENIVSIGDYIFVHAGIEPGLPLAEQSEAKLRWIREPFLSYRDAHEGVVIHGHTITDAPVDQGNRIGIDTGAYASGRLTTLVLEGENRRYITALDDGGEISICSHDEVE
ncbi:metallophosphoesterase family protein [Aurantiacibacter rhizosphaerae]|uniref:Serine/threonine protein phosphatase n=1 Tax=Aurantiacibacter rhizosphaerae TaxID=2691582 RepID=A0A844XCP2_9SPHN|nr:metallophosphoesterase family protein [Aurantiacibacter rhizosphaerae]MWV27275.1 serine/threonine protein phosphatase [Aurantiacibacter rhizosphaerae]